MSEGYNNKISKEGEEFILSLNMYLVSTGKSEVEIKEFIEEAEQHLILGEQEGKSVKDIFGNSLEEYAKSVADELSFSKKDLIETVLMFIIGFGTWIFLSGIKNGIVTMSVMEVISIPLVYLLTMILLVILARKFAFKDKKFSIGIFVLFCVNICALVIIGLIGKNMEQSIVINKLLVSIIVGVLFLLSLIASKKIDTWFLMLPFIFYIPVIIESFTNINFGENVLVKIIPLILCVILGIIESKRMIKSND